MPEQLSPDPKYSSQRKYQQLLVEKSHKYDDLLKENTALKKELATRMGITDPLEEALRMMWKPDVAENIIKAFKIAKAIPDTPEGMKVMEYIKDGQLFNGWEGCDVDLWYLMCDVETPFFLPVAKKVEEKYHKIKP